MNSDTTINNCSTTWFVCKYCKRAYQQREQLIFHKLEEHSLFREERASKRAEKKQRKKYDKLQSARFKANQSTVNQVLISDHSSKEKINLEGSSNTSNIQMENLDHDINKDLSTQHEEIFSPLQSRGCVGGRRKRSMKSVTITTCQICRRMFSGMRSLMTHMKSHEKSESYLCNFCHKTLYFRNEDYFHRHQIKCSGDSHFQCPLCEARFTFKGDLQSHELTHESIFCRICFKPFTRKSCLVTHMLTHDEKEND